MGVRIERIDLRGFGVRNDVITNSRSRVSVVPFRSGERDLAFFNADDPDSNAASISLTDDEASAIA
ncbi:potassium transporter TrkA, partial [Salinibacterium amurskyense]